jgi:hypothetical protein
VSIGAVSNRRRRHRRAHDHGAFHGTLGECATCSTPAPFGPSRRALTQQLSAARRADLFDVRTFGPQPSDRQLSRCRRDWQRHARLLASFSWPERLVITIGEIAVAYLALVREGPPQRMRLPQRYNHYRCCIEIRDALAGALHAYIAAAAGIGADKKAFLFRTSRGHAGRRYRIRP